MNRNGQFGLDPLRGDRRQIRPHSEPIPNGYAGDVRLIDLADDLHVSEEPGVAAVIDCLASDMDNKPARHTHIATFKG